MKGIIDKGENQVISIHSWISGSQYKNNKNTKTGYKLFKPPCIGVEYKSQIVWNYIYIIGPFQ